MHRIWRIPILALGDFRQFNQEGQALKFRVQMFKVVEMPADNLEAWALAASTKLRETAFA